MIKVICSLVPTTALAVQSRDNARFPTGTAVLTGVVVTDEQNAQPVRRALVTATLNGDTASADADLHR